MLALLMLWSILVTLGCAGMAQEPAVAAMTREPNQEAPVAAVTQEPEPAVAAVTLEPEPGRVDALVLIRGGVSYAVDLAVTSEERQQGLSGREQMAQDEGMLFVFEEEQGLSFWMKEMHFPLDIIWIDAQCRLIDVAAEVPTPPPGAESSDIPRAKSPSPARYVLEVNAGESERNGLQPGDLVEFQGAIAGKYGC